MLAPTHFNIYTNDQPTNLNTKHFLYADDLAITTQKGTFEEVTLLDTFEEDSDTCPERNVNFCQGKLLKTVS